jgi:hypothetical protein
MHLTKQRFGALLAYASFTLIAVLVALFIYRAIVPLFPPTGWLQIGLGALLLGETVGIARLGYSGKGLYILCYLISLSWSVVAIGVASALASSATVQAAHITHLLLVALAIGLLPLLAVCGLHLKEAA